MPYDLTKEAKIADSLTKENKDNDITWDEATMTWDEANRTWESPGRPVTRESKISDSLTKESKT